MLHSHTNTLLNANQDNKNGLDTLCIKMQQSLDNLECIQNLLTGTNIGKKSGQNDQNEEKDNSLLTKVEEDCKELKSELEKKDKSLLEMTRLLQQAQRQVEELQKSLATLSIKYGTGMDSWQNKYNNSVGNISQLKQEYNDLRKENQDLNAHVDRLKDLHEKEVQRRDQLELLLRESAQEQKITTETVIERDEKIEELQEVIKCIHQNWNEKDILLNEEIEKLKQENSRYKKRLDNLDQLYEHKEEKKKDDFSQELNIMKQDLLLYQEKLIEKISQNRELENAMERVNEHVEILKKSLNETRKESSDRYNKMMMYREENQYLRANK
jgi:chromosome segregation ATPase